MADNVQLNQPTTSGATIATDDIGGVQHQLIKQEFGVDGVATMVSAADPLPTTDAAVLAKLSTDPSTETTLAALLAKVIAAPSTEAKQDAANALLTTIAAITQPLTDAQLRATPVPVSGTVAITGAGDATAANQTDLNTLTGIVTETAPVSDTASSGLNGRLQRIAQRITSLINTLGSPFQSGGSIGNTAFGVNNAAGASAVNIQDGGNSITVDGTVAISGSVPVTGTFFQATQPVSAASLPLPTLAATSTIQTDGTQKSIVRGGAKGATIAADVTSTNQSADRQALDVQIRTSAGVAVDTFGGGTQYADGAARGTATGTMMIGDDGTNVQSVKVDSNGILARNISTPTKTGGNSIITLQSVAASSVLVSSAVDVSTKWKASLNVFFGRRSASSAGAGVNIYIEGSTFASGDDNWATLAQYTTGFAAAEAEAVTGVVAAGATVITCASTTNLTAQDYIYIDNGTIANSEWRRIKSIVAATSVTVIDALTNAQTSSTMYDSAETYNADLDLSSIMRIRVVADGSLYTQAFAIKVTSTYLDSIV